MGGGGASQEGKINPENSSRKVANCNKNSANERQFACKKHCKFDSANAHFEYGKNTQKRAKSGTKTKSNKHSAVIMLLWLLAFLACFCFAMFALQMQYASGQDVIAGDADANTIYVASQADLDEIANNCNNNGKTYAGKTIKVTADFTITASTWTPIGIDAEWTDSQTPTHYFAGTFNGQNHTITISGTITKTLIGTPNSRSYYGGLFGYVKSGTIKNIKIINKWDFDVTYDSVNEIGMSYIGGIVGAIDSGKINSCIVVGDAFSMSIKHNGAFTNTCFGGIVSYAIDSQINNCSLLNGVNFSNSYIDEGGIVYEMAGASSIISDCEVECDFICSPSSRIAAKGLIAGTAVAIQNCSVVSKKIEIGSHSIVDTYVGLIAAKCETISNCTIIVETCSMGSHSGGSKAYLGVLAGSATTITNCFANVNLTEFSCSGDSAEYQGAIAGKCTNAYNCVVMDTGGTVTMSKLTYSISGISNTTNGLYYVTSDTDDNLKKETTFTANSGAGTNGYAWNKSYKWNFETVWFMDTKSMYNDGFPYLFAFKSKAYITLNVTVNNDREYILYMLDANGTLSRQFVVKNGSKVGFNITEGEKFTIKVYETLYLRCTIDGESTLSKTFENLTRDTGISIVLSGANNVNNWLVV